MPGWSKLWYWEETSQMYRSPDSAMVAAVRVCGERRRRFVVLVVGMLRDSRIGSSSVSESSSSSSESSFSCRSS